MTAQLVPIQAATVIRGQRAWAFIKKSAADQRQAWCEVGEALAYGRAMHPKDNNKFGLWLTENGFEDIKRDTRADAMWLAQNWGVIGDSDNEQSHPTWIRKSFNAAQADTPPAPELTLSTPSRLTASIEQVAPQAKTINKLAAMAELGEGQEQITAQKYLAKKAHAFGMEADELAALSKKLDPSIGVPANLKPVLDANLQTLAEIVAELVAFVRTTRNSATCSTPLSNELAISLVLSAFNRLEN